jgi:hypothetical protein
MASTRLQAPQSDPSESQTRDTAELKQSTERMRGPDVNERRVAPRYVVEADIVFASEYQELFGTTFDVSVGGAGIVAFRLLPVRTPIRVKLTLPQGLLMCDAEIRWVLPAKGRLGRVRTFA